MKIAIGQIEILSRSLESDDDSGSWHRSVSLNLDKEEEK